MNGVKQRGAHVLKILIDPAHAGCCVDAGSDALQTRREIEMRKELSQMKRIVSASRRCPLRAQTAGAARNCGRIAQFMCHIEEQTRRG
jgi:hypothetical protein